MLILRSGRCALAFVACAMVTSGCASADASRRPYALESDEMAFDDAESVATAGGGFFGRSPAKKSAPQRRSGPAGSTSAVDLAMVSDVQAAPAPAPPSPPAESAPESPTTPTPPAEARTRLIIYTANFSLLVADANASIASFIADVEATGGYLSQRSNTSVTVRVPATDFQAVLDKLPLMGVIRHRQISSQDVTAQFQDITLRLDTALKSRTRLTALLERAEKMEDILRIEAEVRRLTQEIESMKGRLRQLSDQIAFSTITVDFQKDAPEIAPLNRQRYSRFAWIRRVGLERVLSDF